MLYVTIILMTDKNVNKNWFRCINIVEDPKPATHALMEATEMGRKWTEKFACKNIQIWYNLKKKHNVFV